MIDDELEIDPSTVGQRHHKAMRGRKGVDHFPESLNVAHVEKVEAAL